jgi:RNA polymerase sigma factor (sigma-70 family)
MTYSNLTDKERNQLAKQYEPLVNKMTKQFSTKVAMSWGEIKSMAYEGLALAIKQYDEERSDMSFTQFAAFAIRNNILTSLDNELRTVKMSNYAQKKAIESGDALFTTVSIEGNTMRDDNDSKVQLDIKLGMYSNATFADGDVYEYLYSRIDEQFGERDRKIFYMTFGLNGYDNEKNKDIAKMLGVSEGLVSQRAKKVVEWIRKDRDLCEMLSNLLER